MTKSNKPEYSRARDRSPITHRQFQLQPNLERTYGEYESTVSEHTGIPTGRCAGTGTNRPTALECRDWCWSRLNAKPARPLVSQPGAHGRKRRKAKRQTVISLCSSQPGCAKCLGAELGAFTATKDGIAADAGNVEHRERSGDQTATRHTKAKGK